MCVFVRIACVFPAWQPCGWFQSCPSARQQICASQCRDVLVVEPHQGKPGGLHASACACVGGLRAGGGIHSDQRKWIAREPLVARFFCSPVASFACASWARFCHTWLAAADVTPPKGAIIISSKKHKRRLQQQQQQQQLQTTTNEQGKCLTINMVFYAVIINNKVILHFVR